MTIANYKSWKENWVIHEKLKSGGQGNAYAVKSKQSPYDILFLKENKRNDESSRERMYLEVASYEILIHPCIPKLIESNAAFFRDNKYKLYLVTEYIPGNNLHDHRESSNIINTIDCIIKLCDIVSYYHSKGVVHRDIKPKNIILRNNDWMDPVLVDFGLSFNEFTEREVSQDQQLGNIFLRLPEQNKGSALKRDPRTDITLCAGMLFFLLTNNEPNQLYDENGNMPHQRPGIYEILHKHSKVLNINKLQNFFDKAFDHRIDRRFQTIEDMMEDISNLKNNGKSQMINDSDIERIRNRVNTHNHDSIKKTISLLESVIQLIPGTLYKLGEEIMPNMFNSSAGNYKVEKQLLQVENTLGLIHKTDTTFKFIRTYLIHSVGNEIVLFADNEPIFRCHEESISESSALIQESIRKYAIAELAKIS